MRSQSRIRMIDPSGSPMMENRRLELMWENTTYSYIDRNPCSFIGKHSLADTHSNSISSFKPFLHNITRKRNVQGVYLNATVQPSSVCTEAINVCHAFNKAIRSFFCSTEFNRHVRSLQLITEYYIILPLSYVMPAICVTE